jgi:hypothetical protein
MGMMSKLALGILDMKKRGKRGIQRRMKETQRKGREEE